MNDHLNALNLRLSNERIYLQNAKNNKEKELRKVWIAQIEKEIASEQKFNKDAEISDDDLLSELGL